ncbi:baculoviral IAP repeat-containing protein 3 [Colletotrichum tofieldiae]|uniref:Baculoviral IAP repeat-containing protein 3 n=1 Tax=Colletotrichum tofieldiae TaxID=708197 RepID=A0A166LEV4_9PEZI|nr:baculoviral IAP repeat-containing protein 3 [Colletotrichum tofieldiae]GKT67120.1 baculoviral IAP repeat-containing protein 3 [Colletotrichum tofieldiae]GKT80285.1 baculoviral IAP repeat-containing protein 3 [Colletotrichum tofieldiae]
MDEFCVRLLSFFERGADGKPGRWPHPSLSPEDMAGAGFRLQGSQAWKWEKKDDPFQQHQDASPKCEYVASSMFEGHHDVFVKKQPDKKETTQWPITPPATPTKRPYSPRRRMTFSPIITVHESAPSGQATQLSPQQQEQRLTPTEISVTAGEIKFVIQVSGPGERGEFCLVSVLRKTRANMGNRQQENPP